MAKMTGFEKYFVNRRGERFFEKLIDDLETSGTLKITGNSRILELGGGNGALSSLIYKRYQPASYTFTDYDPDQLALAQESMKERFGEVPRIFHFPTGRRSRSGLQKRQFRPGDSPSHPSPSWRNRRYLQRIE